MSSTSRSFFPASQILRDAETVDFIIDMQSVREESNKTVKSCTSNSSASPPIEVYITKERIAQAVLCVIQLTPHKRFSKPWSEVIVRIPRDEEDAAILLLGRIPQTTSYNDRYLRWEFSGYEVAEWFEGVGPALIHPVPFEGQMNYEGRTEESTNPAWAIWEGLQAMLEKTTGLLYLMFRTRVVGLGRPVPGVYGPPMDLWGTPVQQPHPHHHYQIQQYINELQYLQWNHQQQMMQLPVNSQMQYQAFAEQPTVTTVHSDDVARRGLPHQPLQPDDSNHLPGMYPQTHKNWQQYH